MPIRYFPAAREDIKKTLKWSAEHFGEEALQKYKKLLSTAIAEIHADPELINSYAVKGLQPGIRLYHLKHSRKRAAIDGFSVGRPRHFIAYMVLNGDTVIVRVLHERMDITRHLNEEP